MEEKIIELKMRFRAASKDELAAINKEMQGLAKENPEAFSKVMLEDLKKTLQEVAELTETKSRIY